MGSIDLAAISMGISLAAIMLSSIAILLSAAVWAKMVGVEKSTHQVQFVPLETSEGKPIEGKELDENMKAALGGDYMDIEQI